LIVARLRVLLGKDLLLGAQVLRLRERFAPLPVELEDLIDRRALALQFRRAAHAIGLFANEL
jgi:hypothetical protein